MAGSLTFHTAIYSASNFLTVIAGLITFPLITRVMSVEEYGLLNLISLTIMILVGLGKAGLQTSILRFGSEARSDGKDFREADVYLTALTGMFVIVIVMQVIWLAASPWLPLSLVGDERVYGLFIIASLLIIGEVMTSGAYNIFVSEKKSVLISVLKVGSKYSLIALLVPGLIFFEEKLFVFYALSGVHALIFAALFIYLCHRKFSLFQGRFSLSLSRKLLTYGLPLIGYEVIWHVFAYGDRLQINYFLGTEPLGYYAAASNLCTYIQVVLVTSMTTAVTPMYMDRWEKEGKEATETFLATCLRYYLLVAIAAAFGLTAVGADLLELLAGEKYVEGARAIPFIIVGMLIGGVALLAAAGLTIMKRTKLMMGLVIVVAVVNVLLNLVFIPWFGLQGAAMATLLSFLLYAAINAYVSRDILAWRLDLQITGRYFLAGLIMYLAVTSIDLQPGFVRLVAQIITGGLIYGSLVFMLDRDLRQLVVSHTRPIWNMLAQRFA